MTLLPIFLLAFMPVIFQALISAESPESIEQRLSATVEQLAGEEFGGRGNGAEGLEMAAEFIADQYEEIGLKTNLFDGGPFQKFTIPGPPKPSEGCTVSLIGPPKIEGGEPVIIGLEMGVDFTPLLIGGSGEFDLPIAFAGYGITAKAEEYDDYETLDAEGKAVLLLRHEPQQEDAQSVFDGTEDSQYASMSRKVAIAKQNNAAAVIFCTDHLDAQRQSEETRRMWLEAIDQLNVIRDEMKKDEPLSVEDAETYHSRIEEALDEIERLGEQLVASQDSLLPFSSGGRSRGDAIPVIHCRRSVLNQIVASSLEIDLAAVEQVIDDNLSPQSEDLEGWRIVGNIEVNPTEIPLRNVVATLPGEGPLADEVIVIGGHYDHVGMRTPRDGGAPVIHPGADDNASGISVMLEIARTMSQRDERPARTLVFVAFAGEELGLHGSRHYVESPLVPLEDTVAMVNLDMVGRLREGNLSAICALSGNTFPGILEGINVEGLCITPLAGGPGGSDHGPFLSKEIPAIFFFTGMHEQYHRPTDTMDLINPHGMRLVADAARQMITAINEEPIRPEYLPLPKRPGRRVQLGVMTAPAPQGEGCLIRLVVDDGPAQKAGLKPNDVLVEFNGQKIASHEELVENLRNCEAGDLVSITVLRGEEKLTVEATLAGS
jgi:hypothetical protein